MGAAQAVGVPEACSPLEGILLLAVLLTRQAALLDDAGGEPLDEARMDLRELRARLGVVVDSAEGGPWPEAALPALLLKAGLEVEPTRPRRRAELPQRLAQGAALSAELARQARLRFAGSGFEDEFRLCQEWAEELGRQLARTRF